MSSEPVEVAKAGVRPRAEKSQRRIKLCLSMEVRIEIYQTVENANSKKILINTEYCVSELVQIRCLAQSESVVFYNLVEK